MSPWKPSLCAALLLLRVPLAEAQPAPPSADSLRSMLTPWITTSAVAGLAVAVRVGDSTRFVGLGRAGAPGSAPPTDSTTFEIGSITKVFVGTLLADMVLRGEVSLDDPVKRYLSPSTTVPTRNGKVITLRHLVTHFSGLPRDPDNLPAPSVPGGDAFADYDTTALRAFLSSHNLRRDPGDSTEYSNLGMSLLAHALANRAGMSFERLLDERIFKPLGMHDSHITPNGQRAAREATGHSEDLEIAPAWGVRRSVMQGAGAIKSSTRDMMKFARAVIERPDTPIGRALRLSITPIRHQSGNDSVGFAWPVNFEAAPAPWHNGGTGGFSSMLAIDPGNRRASVVLTNTYRSVGNLGWALIDPEVRLRIPSFRPTVAQPVEVLDRLVGMYHSTGGAKHHVYREGDRLWFDVFLIPRMQLHPLGATTFYTKAGRDMTFLADSTGAITELVMKDGQREWRLKRM
jgi:D-alanyl-D-alanine-carboxypeptidase/D-alanyl-D-alanine-endopeptidase